MSAEGYRLTEQGAEIKFRGVITADDALKMHNVVYSHPRSGAVDYLIIDAQEVTDIEYDVPKVIGYIDRAFSKYNPLLSVYIVPGSMALLNRFADYQAVLADTNWRFFVLPTLPDVRAFKGCQ